MIDLSQAISLEPVQERIQLFEPIKWCPPILQQRSGKGKLIEGMDWAAFIFGIVLAVLGISLFLMVFGLVPFVEAKEGDLLKSIILNIMAFPLWSVFIWFGWYEIKKRKQLEKNRTLKPKSPWLWDFNWKPNGIGDNRLEQILYRTWMVLISIGFLGPITWMVFFIKSTSYGVAYWLVASMFVLLDLIFFAGLVLVIYQILHIIKYKNPKFRFQKFPFFLGDRAKGQLANLPKSFDRMIIDIRLIEEVHEQRGRNYIVKFFQLYNETKIFEKSPLVWDGVLNIDWKLPDDSKFTTTLNEQPSKYWELEVKAKTTGIDFHSRFLLPVYEPYN